ncbi:MAG TPA: Zn-dependent alcohol dehydrogenase [Dongiaceae bacterium]|nr:Zn-dependent alcohol dehydrogenase [Dongiaceae bacterium]
MKAAVCRAFGQPLAIEEVEIAEPGPGEIKVKIAACAICHSDIHYIEGAWGGQLPAVYGHEAAGTVESVGPGVDAIAPGDHVVVTLIRSCGHCHYCIQGAPTQCETKFALDAKGPLTGKDGAPVWHGLRTGAFAEYAVVHASQAVAIDRKVPLDSASLLGCGVITGYGAVANTARLPSGAHVAVIGTGGVGLNAIQAASLLGARSVIAIDVSAEKREAARAFGATHGVDPRAEKPHREIRALTGGRGADFVFVTVGAKEAVEQAFTFIGRGGTVVIVGMPADGVMASFEPTRLAAAGQKVLGSLMGSTRVPVDIPALVDLYKQRRLKLDELITGRYPLERINEAIASVLRGEALRNVIVFS